jgi:small subunit ribosomal protein S8
MTNFVIADALTRMQNAVMVGKNVVEVPNKKVVVYILDILKKEGMIEDFDLQGRFVKVFLKYDDANKPVVTKFKTVSKPGQRIYVTYKDLVPVLNGKGIGIVSTSAGVMPAQMAKARKLGGEYICKIW